MQKSIAQLENEYEDYMYLASGLTQTHQQTMRNDLINKANSIKEEIFEQEQEIKQNYKNLMKGFK